MTPSTKGRVELQLSVADMDAYLAVCNLQQALRGMRDGTIDSADIKEYLEHALDNALHVRKRIDTIEDMLID